MPSDPRPGSPFDPDVASLLERERSDAFGGAAPHARAAQWRRLEHAALALAVAGAVPGLALTAEAANKALSATLADRLKRLLQWAVSSNIAGASALVLMGGLAGAVLEARYGEPRAHAVAPAPRQTEARIPPTDPASASGAVDPAIPSVDIDSLPVAPRSEPRPAAPPSSAHAPTALGDEEHLLDRARAAVARGAYAAALDSLGEDAQRFPNGPLVEERELLFVQALAGAGRSGEAAARARAFEARFPQSIFLPSVRAASPSKGE